MTASTAVRTNYANNLSSRSLLTSAAVTPEKRDEAIAAAKEFLSLGTTLARRRQSLAGGKLVGVLLSHRLGHLKPIYIPTLGQVGVSGGDPESRFVSQGINDVSNLQPESAPVDIVNNVVFLVEDEGTTLPELWAPNAGEPFTKADLSSVPNLQRLIPDETATYRFVLCPKSLPIVMGQSASCRGQIDDTTVALLEEALPGSGLWAQWMTDWSQDIHDAVLAASTGRRNQLGKKLPTLKTSSKPLAASALTVTETLYADDSAAENALADLRKRLFEAVPQAPAPPAEVPIPETAPAANKEQASPPAPAPLRPALRTAGTVETDKRIPRKTTFASYSEEEQLAVRYRLGYVAFDAETGTIGVPELHDDTEFLFFSCSAAKKRNDALEDRFRTYGEECDSELDFLRRMFDMPLLSQGGLAILVNTLPSTMPATELSENIKYRFRPHLMAPDNAATLRARESYRDDRAMEMMCGEDATNLSKVDISIHCNVNVLAKDPFMTMLANRCGAAEATVVVNKDQWDDVANPLIYKFCREMAMAITTKSARQWFKTAPFGNVRKFFGWLLQMWDSYECFLGTIPVASRNQLHVLNEELSKIPLEAITKAEMLREEIMSTLGKIIQGTRRVPDSPIYTKLEDAEAKKRKAEIEATKAKTPKTPKTEKDRQPTEEDRAGIIICTKKGAMPFPPGEGTANRICAAFVRVGAWCRQGKNCPNIHSLTPETWPGEALKCWYPHVEGNDTLKWTAAVKLDAVKAAYEKITGPTEGK